MTRITAQVACEAIVNHPDDGWDMATIYTVLTDARELGVPALYVDMLTELADARAISPSPQPDGPARLQELYP